MTKVSVADGILVQDLGSELVLCHVQSDQYIALNPVAAAMWQALLRTESVEAAHRALCTEYDATSEELHRDLLQLIDQLAARGILHITQE